MDAYGYLAFFLILFVCIYLLITRSKYLKSEKKLESFASRESGFLFNNVIFVSICFSKKKLCFNAVVCKTRIFWTAKKHLL